MNTAFVSPRYLLFSALALLLVLGGCSTKQKDQLVVSSTEATQVESSTTAEAAVSSASFEDYEFEDYADSEPAISDPLEGWNRMWFGFNDFVLMRVVKPVYTGYTYVTPEPIRNGISNAYHNIKAPIRMINCLLQGRFGEAWIELGKFIVNTTAGFGGIFDITKEKKPKIPVDGRDADFGQTLASWGVGEGIYLVWPFFGPSTARDTVGLVGDAAASPFFWACDPIGPVDWEPLLAANIGFRFNDFGEVIESYEAITKSAIEPYVAVRDAYVKYRRAIYTPQRMN